MKRYSIAVAGTGYVGLSLATLLSQHNHVVAVDVIPEKVELINRRRSPIQDEYIEKYLAEKDLDLEATLDGASAYRQADYIVIAAPTNYDSKKNFFDTSHVEEVIELVRSVNREAVMVIKSTIPVGYCEGLYKKYGRGLRLLFFPEFLRESKALYDNLYPSRIIAGIPHAGLASGTAMLKESAEIFVALLKQGALKEDIETVYMGMTEAEAVKGLYEQMEMRESMPLLSLAETVTEGKTSDTGKLQAILTFVNRDFGHSPLSLEETGYRMRHVEEVINSAYGTEAELTDLLQGLLNALKIPAEVCAVFPANDAPEDSYGLKGARLFVRAVADGRTYLLNAASDKMDAAGWLADRCRVVSLKTDKPVELPAADAAIRCTVAMQIDSTTVTSVMKSDIAEALRSYTKAADEETTATDRLILTNGYAVVNLPEPAAGAATKRYAAWNTTRDRNLVLPYAPDESYTYTLDIPEGMTLCMPTDGYTLTNAAGSMSFSLKQTGNKLEVKRSLKVNSRLIKKADYPAFHALMAAWANPKQKSVIVYID